MRIIGGRDYYDITLAYGHDTHVVYVRGKEELSEKEARDLGLVRSQLRGVLHEPGEELYQRWGTTRVRGTEYEMTFPTVVACGRRYQGVRISVTTPFARPYRNEQHFCWTEEQFQDFLGTEGLQFGNERERKEVEAYFTPTELSPTLLEAVMDRRWTLLVHNPTSSYGSRGEGHPWAVDQPVLRDLKFARALRPETLFQDIERWVGGVLPEVGREMVQLSDRERIWKHGMDPVTSFRRPPSKQR